MDIESLVLGVLGSSFEGNLRVSQCVFSRASLAHKDGLRIHPTKKGSPLGCLLFESKFDSKFVSDAVRKRD